MEIVESFFRMSKAICFGMNFSTNKISIHEESYWIFMEMSHRITDEYRGSLAC